MELNDYMIKAARTDTCGDKGILSLLIASMGMVSEAGETVDHLKKHLHQGHPLNVEELLEEAGDCLWYIAKLARACGTTLDELAQLNLVKLQRRYPNGFSPQASIERKI